MDIVERLETVENQSTEFDTYVKGVIDSPDGYVQTLSQTVRALNDRLNSYINQKSNDQIFQEVIDSKLQVSNERMRKLTGKVEQLEELVSESQSE